MTERPRVSLIMPVWEPRPDWLEAAVRSALDSGSAALELVVVDDGCPAPVEELLRGVEDARLRVLRVEHGGPYSARNAGIEGSTGETIRFVDADDVLPAGSTDRLLQHVGGRDDVLGYGATLVCDEALRPVWKMTSRASGDARRDCVLGRFTVRLPSLLLPRRVVEAAGSWDVDFKVSGDWDYILRALDHAEVRGDTAVATLYRRHRGSVTGDIDAGQEGARRVVEGYLRRHPEDRTSSLGRRAEAMLAAKAARVNATHQRPGQAVAQLGRALLRDPRAVATELVQSAPAVRGRVARLLGGPR
jgi:glycosyltransferase involved in cell wall biosynthesis